MPANLTPQYMKAEEEFKQAKTAKEKLAGLKRMYAMLPKHKGTEKMQADLKTRMKEMKEDVEQEKKSGKKGLSFKFPKQGAGQVILLGGPNVGKSTLLNKLTKASPDVAPYPFTTHQPQPGMMPWQDVHVQLIDTPPITGDYMEGYLSSIVRGADAALLVVDLGDDDGPTTADDVIQRLTQTKTILAGPDWPPPEEPGHEQVKTMLVANKKDQSDAAMRLEMVRELFGDRFPIHVLSAETGDGLEEFRTAIYRFLNVVRVYTKQPGKPPDMSAPFTTPAGSTLIEMAALVHRDFAENLKFARIWGTDVYDGQTVKRDHVLHDGDVVELHG